MEPKKQNKLTNKTSRLINAENRLVFAMGLGNTGPHKGGDTSPTLGKGGKEIQTSSHKISHGDQKYNIENITYNIVSSSMTEGNYLYCGGHFITYTIIIELLCCTH